MLKTKFEARVYLWNKFNNRRSITAHQAHKHFDELLTDLEEGTWEEIVQRLRSAENHNIHFIDEFATTEEEEADGYILELPSVDKFTRISRASILMDPYQLATDTLTKESIPTDELENIRQDLQSGMVDQCRALMTAKREALDNIHHKLTSVQSLLLYTERFGRQPVIDAMATISGGNGRSQGSRGFSATGPGGVNNKPDRTQLATVTLMNDKIIEARLRLDKAERGIAEVKDRLNIDETTFADLGTDQDEGIAQRSASITPFASGSFINQSNKPFSSGIGPASSPVSERKSLSAVDLFGSISESNQPTSLPSPAPTLSQDSPSASAATPSKGSTGKMKRRASTSAAAVPLLLPAGSVLDDDSRAIIAELEDWDKERDQLNSEIQELQLAILRANKKLHKLKHGKN